MLIAIVFSRGTDTDCIHHQHTPLSTGDASPRQGHGQLLLRVVSTLEWCRNLSTAGFTQLKPERRSTKSGLWVWTRELRNPAGMGHCSLRARKAPSGAASSADRGPASPQEDRDRRRKTPAIENYRIFSTMRWKDRGDGRSSTTLMCKCSFGLLPQLPCLGLGKMLWSFADRVSRSALLIMIVRRNKGLNAVLLPNC